MDGGEDVEELQEEEAEEKTGTEEEADPRRSLQFSESLPLETFAGLEGGNRGKTRWHHQC